VIPFCFLTSETNNLRCQRISAFSVLQGWGETCMHEMHAYMHHTTPTYTTNKCMHMDCGKSYRERVCSSSSTRALHSPHWDISPSRTSKNLTCVRSRETSFSAKATQFAVYVLSPPIIRRRLSARTGPPVRRKKNMMLLAGRGLIFQTFATTPFSSLIAPSP
jgi:hypothetical protein